MKNLTCALALTAAILPATSIADTKNFEGVSVGLNLNMVSAGIDATEDTGERTFLGGKQAFSAGLDVAYGFSLSDSGVMTVGLEADVTSPEIWNTAGGPDGVLSLKQKNRYGLYFAPGVVVTKDTLIYGKVGYNSMKGEIEGGGGRISDRFTGVGYGFGVKTMISPQAFLKIEINRHSYGSEVLDGTSIKPAGTTGVLGIGTSF
jgi:hypothetical protein